MFNRITNNSARNHTEVVDDNVTLLQTKSITSDTKAASSELSLLQLIRQHQHQPGWILLVAPSHIPDKEWAEHYQLSLNNVLVIHQKQIDDLDGTLTQALTSSSCKVVINFATPSTEQQLDNYRKLARVNNIWFYQSESQCQNRRTH